MRGVGRSRSRKLPSIIVGVWLVATVGVGVLLGVAFAVSPEEPASPGKSAASSAPQAETPFPLPAPSPSANAGTPLQFPTLTPTPPPSPTDVRAIEMDPREAERRALDAEYRRKLMQVTSMEERYALDQWHSDELEKRGLGRIEFWGGPPTRGAEVIIAGATVKLPDDAELDGLVMCATPVMSVDGDCPGCEYLDDLPWFRIVRGDSVISIGLNTGVVVGGRVAPGEECAFDFLKHVFPDQAEAIEALPVKAPSNR